MTADATPNVDPTNVKCPTCKQAAGEPCVEMGSCGGFGYRETHESRKMVRAALDVLQQTAPHRGRRAEEGGAKVMGDGRRDLAIGLAEERWAKTITERDMALADLAAANARAEEATAEAAALRFVLDDLLDANLANRGTLGQFTRCRTPDARGPFADPVWFAAEKLFAAPGPGAALLVRHRRLEALEKAMREMVDLHYRSPDAGKSPRAGLWDHLRALLDGEVML